MSCKEEMLTKGGALIGSFKKTSTNKKRENLLQKEKSLKMRAFIVVVSVRAVASILLETRSFLVCFKTFMYLY